MHNLNKHQNLVCLWELRKIFFLEHVGGLRIISLIEEEGYKQNLCCFGTEKDTVNQFPIKILRYFLELSMGFAWHVWVGCLGLAFSCSYIKKWDLLRF
jgi:hypothetical protein